MRSVELAVVWVVLIALGTFVGGLIGGWFVARRAQRSSATTPTADAGSVDAAAAVAPTTTPPADTPSAEATAEPAMSGADGDAEVSGHRLSPGAGTDRHERDDRARYAEIIGIETENASLRAVAARVPGLERRIRELEAVVEDHTGTSDSVIDLTGPEPVVRRGDADIASR